MTVKLCYLDYEFNGISERDLNLVSVSFQCYVDRVKLDDQSIWLYDNPEGWSKAAEELSKLIAEGYTFVAYVMTAEARATITLLLPEMPHWLFDFRCIDLYLEYRNLLNHNHDFAYGWQLIKGEEIFTKPPLPKWSRLEGEEEDEDRHRPEHSLAAACYKFLRTTIDTKEKDEVRGLIIRGNPEEIKANRERILAYNKTDVDVLPRLLSQFYRTHANVLGTDMKQWLKGALSRGEYAVSTAIMVRLGYPVNMQKVRKFTGNAAFILDSAIENVVNTPMVVPGSSPPVDPIMPFRRCKKTHQWICNTKNIQRWVGEYIEKHNLPHWRKTSGGKRGEPQLSISKDAFADWFDSQSEGFPGAYCRYLKTKQALYGFTPSSSGKKGVFTDFVGKDERVRPHFGIYGSQSSRSQPGAVGFIPLKAHWMRNFIEAPCGRALAGVDYASQEFLIAAILSQDKKMMDAYASGDVYLAFAKDIGLVPPHGCKADFALAREACKTTVLGISYDMSAKGLAPRLARVLKRKVAEEEAQAWIDKFMDNYHGYSAWKGEIQEEYRTENRLCLSDGWTMWGDNPNPKSVGNFPIQGTGAVIMREAVKRAQRAGLDIIFTLHDALYLEYVSYKTGAIATLMDCMQVAFQVVMSVYGNVVPIRLEGESWSRDYAKKLPDPMGGITFMSEYSDAKGAADLARYRGFFE